MLSFSCRFRNSRGVTFPEVLVAAVMFAILISGVVYFGISQRRTISTNEVSRNLVKQENLIRSIVVRELQKIGLNPTGSPFDMPPAPITGYRSCNDFPVFDPAPSVTDEQLCFGITDARIHKLEFTGDINGDGSVQHTENFFMAVRDASNVVYDPITLGAPGTMPSYFGLLDMTDYQHTNGYEFIGGAPPWMPNSLPTGSTSSLPQLCTLASGNTFANEHFELVVGTYGAGDATRIGFYRKLLDRVLCFAVAYVRKPHPYERCHRCFALNGAVLTELKRPGPPVAGKCTNTGLPDFPADHFATQTPLLSAEQTQQGLVFMPFPTGGIGQPLSALDPMSNAYSTHLIKIALIIEDEKVWRTNDSASPGQPWTNPLTGRPYRTLRIDIDYYIPESNKPCDVSLGACDFNNSQCSR